MSPYEELANAIIEQAVKDYRNVLKRHLNYPSNRELINELEDLEAFFHSGWYGVLTDLDGEYLISQVSKMVKKEMVA